MSAGRLAAPVLAIALVLAIGAPPMRPAIAADPGVVLQATPASATARLGDDIVLVVVVENKTDATVDLPALRVAGDALTVQVQGPGVRASVVSRLHGSFEPGDGEVRFVTRATRRIVLAPGARREATVRFPAVALGELEFVAHLACDPPLASEAVTIEVVPPAGSRRLLARVETTRGDFTIELDGRGAYNSVAQVWHLARSGFYSELPFHRVVPGRLVQTGDPRGDGTGGPGWFLPAEPADEPFTRGSVGLARGAHTDSAGSQWFVVVAEEPDEDLGAGFARLGSVVEGLDVLDLLAAVEVSPGSTTPRSADRIKRVRMAVR